MDIKSEVRGFHSGQVDQTLYVEQEGKVIAYVDFSEYRGKPHVQMIWVDPDHRREGLGRCLLQDLQRRYPDEEIDLGSLTQDGSSLVASLKYATVTDPHLDRLTKMLSRIKAQISNLEQLSPEEQISKHNEWNRLYDMEHRIEGKLWGQTPTKRIIEHAVRTAPLYNSMEAQYAELALNNNEIMATSTQRFWPDGRRRKEDWDGYQDSYWMKGISFTRDIKYALRWKDITFALDQTKLRQRVKLVPFAWNYHFGAHLTDVDHKREREEFAIMKRTPDDYKRSEEEGGGFDTNRFVKPEGSLKNLDYYLLGIMGHRRTMEIWGEDKYLEKYPTVVNHPKFKGFF